MLWHGRLAHARMTGRDARTTTEGYPMPDYIYFDNAATSLPKPPVVADSSQSDAVKISPMPLAERVKRKIAPRRGFCSLAPGSGALLSLDGSPRSPAGRTVEKPSRCPAGVGGRADALP